MTKIAVLDGYIGVALEYGDWTALPDDAEITVYREAIAPDRLVDELFDYEIAVITQQRARFPRSVLERRFAALVGRADLARGPTACRLLLRDSSTRLRCRRTGQCDSDRDGHD